MLLFVRLLSFGCVGALMGVPIIAGHGIAPVFLLITLGYAGWQYLAHVLVMAVVTAAATIILPKHCGLHGSCGLATSVLLFAAWKELSASTDRQPFLDALSYGWLASVVVLAGSSVFLAFRELVSRWETKWASV